MIWILLMLLPFLLGGLWLCAQIVIKAGFSAWWCLIVLVPVVNIVALWVFAFVEWPAEDKKKAGRDAAART